ncbi:hypothetical protein MLD38_021499 [Melastoma candidum]|uniref:Uncharacterized protein n=1 Tax=Melastoma candidum TaxID=119954 RepID=A0ACB9QGH8_9MYRT|nr:hypothetical protein MLD38_021499 [Melastoma candidum]
MGLPWRLIKILLLQLSMVVIIVFFLVGHCEGSSRSMMTTTAKANTRFKPRQPEEIGHFLGYLPRAEIPIPYSGPSRKHNDIGLQSSSASSP